MTRTQTWLSIVLVSGELKIGRFYIHCSSSPTEPLSRSPWTQEPGGPRQPALVAVQDSFVKVSWAPAAAECPVPCLGGCLGTSTERRAFFFRNGTAVLDRDSGARGHAGLVSLLVTPVVDSGGHRWPRTFKRVWPRGRFVLSKAPRWRPHHRLGKLGWGSPRHCQSGSGPPVVFWVSNEESKQMLLRPGRSCC